MIKRKIAIFTGTRAEYGLLRRLIGAIANDPYLKLQLVVSGTHLSPEFGQTVQEISDDGFHPDATVEMLLSSNTPTGVVKSMGVALIGLADALHRLDPDMLVILGDRFEALAAAQAALIMGIPIAHLHGGETTLGAYDDPIRHAITQMATFHFTSTEAYRERVIAMGASPSSAYNVGALGLDEIVNEEPMTIAQLSNEIGFELKPPYFLVSYHPATKSLEGPAATFSEIMSALNSFEDHQILLTYPNADNGSREIMSIIEQARNQDPSRVFAAASLGRSRYLAAMTHASAVIGNSSSGIIEAPAVGTPSIDVGDRQAGRIAGPSVLRVKPDENSIKEAIKIAISDESIRRNFQASNPYGSGNSVPQIVRLLRQPPRLHTDSSASGA